MDWAPQPGDPCPKCGDPLLWVPDPARIRPGQEPEIVRTGITRCSNLDCDGGTNIVERFAA